MKTVHTLCRTGLKDGRSMWPFLCAGNFRWTSCLQEQWTPRNFAKNLEKKIQVPRHLASNISLPFQSVALWLQVGCMCDMYFSARCLRNETIWTFSDRLRRYGRRNSLHSAVMRPNCNPAVVNESAEVGGRWKRVLHLTDRCTLVLHVERMACRSQL